MKSSMDKVKETLQKVSFLFESHSDTSATEISSQDTNVPASAEPKIYSQVLALFPIYLLQFCYGMNSGYPAIVTAQLRENCTEEFSLDPLQESWVVSLDNIPTIVVCIFSGYLQHKFGPKKTLLLASLPYIVAWLFAATASSVTYLYASRILVGIGHALVTTTVYTVEISSKEMRGTFSLWESVFRCCGCLAVYTFGSFYRWSTIAIFAPIVPGLASISTFFSPESPIYLIQRNQVSEARNSLTKLYGSQYKIDEEVEIIQSHLTDLQNRRQDFHILRNLPDHPEIYKPFFIILTLCVIQQFTGVSILRGYVVTIFEEIFNSDKTNSDSDKDALGSGNTNNCSTKTSSEAYISAIVLAFVRFLASLLLSRLLIHFKRRTMYFFSITFSAVFLASFATCTLMTYEDVVPNYPSLFQWLSLVTSCLFVFCVQLGVQTLPNLLSGELFTSDVRAICKGITRSCTCILLVVSLMMYPFMEQALHIYGTFYFFSIALVLFTPVVYFILPETKDTSLEMVQNFFTPVKTVFYIDIEEATPNTDIGSEGN